MMRKLLVFTDLQMTQAGERIGHLDPAKRFADGLAHALAHHPDAERIVIAGDLTHRGRAQEYARLRDLLRDCPLPVHPMLGNHDRRAAFAATFGGLTEGFAQTAIDMGDARLILLDTLDEDAAPADSGILCAARLAWLDRALAGSDGRRVIVFAHHPPFDTGFAAMDAIGLRNRDALLDRLRAHGKVVQIISGHIHRTISGSAGGIPAAIFKSPCHQAPMMTDAMDAAASVDEPGAYGLLFLMPGGVVVHSEDFGIPGRRALSYA